MNAQTLPASFPSSHGQHFLRIRLCSAPHAGTSGEAVLDVRGLDEDGTEVTTYLHLSTDLLAQLVREASTWSGFRAPRRGDERSCPGCGTRTAFTGYAFEHCSEGIVGTLSCPLAPTRPGTLQ